MEKYDPAKIESKWQKRWEEWGIYKTPDPPEAEGKKTLYVLDMFPYPSGAGLHVGHTRIYTASDVLARYFRMRGYNVLHPMGWDAFGLPAENDAIRKKINPNKLVPQNIANFKRQMKMLGFSYDWEREINTSDPSYYKWTQWLFIQFFKMGLLYQKEVPINWCPHCKTGLANEEVLPGGIHERCGKPVVKREMKQWLFRITSYADRLLNDLEGLDWPQSIIEMQRNWIGRSEGTNIKFSIFNSQFSNQTVEVFTTRPDTIFGVTALVLAPEHPVVASLLSSKFKIQSSRLTEVRRYVEASKRKSELERTELTKEKTGVFTGLFAKNPVNGEKIPVWVADYVIGWYGGGAVMLVPAHDQRDFEFAKKYELPIKIVVDHASVSSSSRALSEAFEGEGILVNSGEFSGLPTETARRRITEWLEKKGWGRRAVSYKLRDWIFSRQRYWGEPIPLVYCEECAKKGITWWDLPEADSFKPPKSPKDPNLAGWFPVPEEELPLKLPYVEKYEPTGTGEGPLAAIKDWVNTKCPHCGGPARRETDTMPNWAGSCWYFIRFAQKQEAQGKKQKLEKEWERAMEEGEKWLPVDWYLGGAEHAVLHLLYARFWVKAMYDLGLVKFKEPFLRLRSVGMVQGEDGRKMSKSLGNVVNPDDVVEAFGADTLRVYEMFMGPFGQAINWSTSGVEGAHRFLKKVWTLSQNSQDSSNATPISLKRKLHRLIKKVGEDIENIKFNTAIAAMMEFMKEMSNVKCQMSNEDWGIFLRLLAPFAPHITEELWSKLPKSPKHPNSIHQQPWPSYDPQLLEEEEVTIIVQVDGKVRDRLRVKKDTARAKLYDLASRRPNVKRFLSGRRVKEMYLVKNRLINFATEPRTQTPAI